MNIEYSPVVNCLVVQQMNSAKGRKTLSVAADNGCSKRIFLVASTHLGKSLAFLFNHSREEIVALVSTAQMINDLATEEKNQSKRLFYHSCIRLQEIHFLW